MTSEDLKKYDFIVAIDRSGSMANPGSHGKTRWQEAEEATVAVANKCAESDDDGITVVLFNRAVVMHENVTDGTSQVARIFRESEPMGGTDTALMLKKVLTNYTANRTRKGVKPIILIVVTDGEPDSQEEVVKAIVEATRVIERDDEIGISFLQVGNDRNATRFLTMLDDDLVSKYGAKFDIVDTKTFDEIESSGMTIAEVLIASLTD